MGSEARIPAQAFALLTASDQDALVAFLDTLGRAEFDHDGDNDVDEDDYAAFQSCFTGPGNFYAPDDPCSISDVDQDGDVDDDDFALFVVAAEGQAGAVPDTAVTPGTPLSLAQGQGNQVVLSWASSCSGGDVDYEVYQGNLGDFASHAPRLCSTGGATSATIDVDLDAYFLIVPTNGFRGGSYGVDSAGNPRPPSMAACLPQSSGACNSP